MSTSPLLVGALAPLSPAGWVDAGRHLLAGLELGAHHVNENGGIGGRPVELLVRDTAADPSRAEHAVDDLASRGVAAVVGEYHSVVARAVAARATALELPFVCSSAVIDALCDAPTDWVARIAPAQSHGWGIYTDHLVGRGHTRVAIAAEPGAYWTAGTRIIRDGMSAHGGRAVELDMAHLAPSAALEALVESGATMVVLLMGHAEPAWTLVRSIRRDPRLTGLQIGAPAGQPELTSWTTELGSYGDAIPFLRYLPDHLPDAGERVARTLGGELGEPPSFVAFEGYDTMLVLAEAWEPERVRGVTTAPAWGDVDVAGTRGRVRLRRAEGSGVWQWKFPPVQVAQRIPASTRFEVLRTG